MRKQALLCGCLVALGFATSAQADNSVYRHWIARIGVHPVSPKPNNHPDFDVNNSAGVSIGATYLLTKHWAIELFSAFPRAYDVNDAAEVKAAKFSMIPSTATLQYHISDPSGRFRIYAGAGLAYARFQGEHTQGSLGGQSLRLDDSTGLTAAVGLDMDLGTRWFVNLDARWADIDSSMTVAGLPRGTLELDPYMFGLSLGRRLR